MMVSGPANRLLLTQDILDFCGALPIYNTELSPSNPAGNASESSTLEMLNYMYQLISWINP